MPTEITGYRVFIASPGGLDKERKAFRETILKYNEKEAIHDGVSFIPVGWEDTLGGVGRPQELINEDLRKCDFFVLLLGDRWGSAPDVDGGKHSSGTEEEFSVALECLADPVMPMQQIVILFKAVGRKQLSDPGPQLQKVLEFKKRLEREKQHLFHNFDSLNAFQDLLRGHLGAWLRDARGDGPPPAMVSPSPVEPISPLHRTPTDELHGEILQQAALLAAQGERTEAEALYAKATVGGNNPQALIEYGRFLLRDGRPSQALTLLEYAKEAAQLCGDDSSLADVQLMIGRVLFTRGDLNGAEQRYRETLMINERLGRAEGMTNAYSSLGDVLQTRGDLSGAEQMLHEALQIHEQLGQIDGVARVNGDLANVLFARGDLDGAEQMLRNVVELEEHLGLLKGSASTYGNLGNVLYTRGDLDRAEQMHRKALEIDERLGRLEGMASTYGNLGVVLGARGDLDGAEEMHRKALEIDRRLGRLEGMANAYGNLGNVLYARGDLDGAGHMMRKALEFHERVGRQEGMANAYGNLGIVLETGRDLDAAEQMYMKALELFRRIGQPHRVRWVEGLLARLPERESTADTEAS